MMLNNNINSIFVIPFEKKFLYCIVWGDAISNSVLSLYICI